MKILVLGKGFLGKEFERNGFENVWGRDKFSFTNEKDMASAWADVEDNHDGDDDEIHIQDSGHHGDGMVVSAEYGRHKKIDDDCRHDQGHAHEELAFHQFVIPGKPGAPDKPVDRHADNPAADPERDDTDQ